MPKLCCNALVNLINNAGDRGLAVLVGEDMDGLTFAVQMRAISIADEGNLPKGPWPTTLKNITLSGSIRIRYCPACGKRLADLAVSAPQYFKELVAKHKTLQNNWGV